MSATTTAGVERSKLTVPIVAVLLAIRSGKIPKRAELLAARRATEIGLVIERPAGWALTPAGDLVLQAYRIGRSRWGAG